MDKEIKYLEKYYKGDIKEAIERLQNGEPVQYIVGNVDFYGYELNVSKKVLIPRRETEELVEEVIKRSINFNNPVIIDVGTGSGAIAVAIAKELGVKVYASDISEDALAVAKENVIKNNADVMLLQGNMLEPYDFKVDILVSNPPYIKDDEQIESIVYNNEPHTALYAGNDGLYYYEEIFKNAHNILNKTYLIALEIGDSQAEDIKRLASKYLPDAKVEIKKDLSSKDRMVFVYNY